MSCSPETLRIAVLYEKFLHDEGCWDEGLALSDVFVRVWACMVRAYEQIIHYNYIGRMEKNMESSIAMFG